MSLDTWQDLIEACAPQVLGSDDRRGQALAAQVQVLSQVYTRRREAIEEASKAHAARLRFFLPRDLLKVVGPLEELGDALPAGPRWRILDVGAGLGTTTLGVGVHALERGVEHLEVVALERDPGALDIFQTLARRAADAGLVPPMTLDARRIDVASTALAGLPEADLVVVGLALNELYPDLEEAPRLDALERWLLTLLGRLAPDGALVVIEPALKQTARVLQRLRERLEPHVYAPCLRQGPCPLLRRPRDWCHAARAVELPKPMAEIARAAGLRWSRLTYSYLTLRRDGRRLLGYGQADALRIVGGPVESKGKTEWDGCGTAGLVRLRRLDRERSESNAALDGALRGLRVRLGSPASDEAQIRFRPGVPIERI